MALVAGLDVDRGGVRAWVCDSDAPSRVLSSVVLPLGPDAASACRDALAAAVGAVGRPGGDYLGITVCADPAAVPQDGMLSAHDWLVLRLSGVAVKELSQACASGLVDVPRRVWARQPGPAPLVEAGVVVGELLDGWALPATLPVVSGCTRMQLVAMGSGAMVEGAVTALVGGNGPVHLQATTAETRLADPDGALLLTHADRLLWAVEPAPASTWGPRDARADLDLLERALGRPASAVVAWAPDAGARQAAGELAARLGREVRASRCADPVATAGAVLVGHAVGAHVHVPSLPDAEGS